MNTWFQDKLAIKEHSSNLIGEDRLNEMLASGKKLRVKFGVDPTKPDLTFGHLVCLQKLKTLQNMGHEIHLIIGSYTACLGDPSGKNETRKVLGQEEVLENAATYIKQVSKILDLSKTVVNWNSDWLRKLNLLEWMSKVSVAQMMQRDDFKTRFANEQSIALSEFVYPILQGYDSVILESDIEIGGNDQLFNLMMGRELQKAAGQPQQVVMTMPLLLGLDGKNKMSKSLNNYISFNDTAEDIFGKVMSIPDSSIETYAKLLCGFSNEFWAGIIETNPYKLKKLVAIHLTEMMGHDGAKENDNFTAKFSGDAFANIEPTSWDEVSRFTELPELAALVKSLMPSLSFTQIKRLIKDGAVKINNEKITDSMKVIPRSDLNIRIGKLNFFKIKS